MREFIRDETEIRDGAKRQDSRLEEQQLDVLRVVYYVYIQYRKYKSALRVLAILLNFEKNDELALLATAYCYFSLKRYRKSANLLKSIKSKMKSRKAKAMYDYLDALTMTEIGNTRMAREIYQKVNVTRKQIFEDQLSQN